MHVERSLSRKKKLLESRSLSTNDLKRDFKKNPLGSLPGYLENRKVEIENEYNLRSQELKIKAENEKDGNLN